MSYQASESSLASAVPYELHEFQFGETDTYWRYADAPVNVIYDGNVFTACYCEGGKIEVGVSALKQQTIVKVNWDNAFAWQYTVAPTEEIIYYKRYRGYGADVQCIFTGAVAGVVFRQSDRKGTRWAEITVDPTSADLQKTGLITRYSRTCGVDLYSTECGVDPSPYLVSGSLSFAEGTVLRDDIFDSYTDSWFSGGIIITNNRRRKIVSHVGREIRMASSNPGIEASLSFNAWPGCNHLYATCVSKFDNGGRCKAQPNIPDDDPNSQWGLL